MHPGRKNLPVSIFPILRLPPHAHLRDERRNPFRNRKTEADRTPRHNRLSRRGNARSLPSRTLRQPRASIRHQNNCRRALRPDTGTSEYYTLLRTSLSEALFVDNRLHEKELIITGRVFPKTQLLEVIRFASIHDGVVHEIYYYCDTCHIRTVAPGNCACCQAPVVLIEKPKQL